MTDFRENQNRWVPGLPLWALDEVLYHGALTRVFRRQVPELGSVICKELLGQNASMRFHHEKGILERLSEIPGVPRLVQGAFPSCTIAMEDSGAVPLNQLVAQGGVGMLPLVQLMRQVAGILAAIHGVGVAHKNLTPDNILFSKAENSPVLIDFSLATTFAEERPAFVHHREIAGTLGYLAPEQTGRTGRAVDQRADLYGLGATFYHLVVGRAPFETSDPLQLIHHILATTPVPPAQLVPSLPLGLSRIIMRLLEKEPDRRYQSAAGVKHDLSRLSQAIERGEGGALVLGERDFRLRLSPPSRLIGRQPEITALRETLAKALQEPVGAVLVSGAPGVGKTALINEMRVMVAEARGWFVSGKFDQQRHDPASSANVQVLRALGRLLLAEPEQELAVHRERLLRVLGPSAGLIAASLPEFGTVLGVAPEAMSGDPVKAQTRLFLAGLDLLRSIASQRPVVIFLDDLQWSEQHSVDFIDTMLTAELPAGLLLVGGYREGAVAPGHPLVAALKRWKRLGRIALSVPLQNLPPDDLALMVQEMLRLKADEADTLVRAVAGKTEGNPYDTVELLNSLRTEGVLHLGEEGWHWSEDAVRRHVGSTDVTEIVVQRLAALPGRTQELVRALSCLGGELPLNALATALSLSLPELEERLAPALKDGVLTLEQRGDALSEALLSFRQDRVQQLVYHAMTSAEHGALRLDGARRLAADPHFQVLAAEKYLQVLDLLDDPGEALEAARLLQRAAAAARTLASHATVERFLAAALKLASAAPEEPFVTALEMEWHSALYSIGRFEDAEQVYRRIAEKAKGPAELVEVACIEMESLTHLGRQHEAVALGLELLESLGVSLPHHTPAALASGLEEWYPFAARLAASEEAQRREVVDPQVLAVARLLQRLMVPSFFFDPSVSAWVVLTCQRLWAQHGPCAALFSGFGGIPFVTIALAEDYTSGARAAEEALKVGEARAYRYETSWVRHCFALFASHWVNPLEESAGQAEKARQGLLHAGDLRFAGFTYNTTLACMLDCAATLGGFAEDLDAALSFTLRAGTESCAPTFEPYARLLLTVQGGGEAPGGFGDPSFDEAAYLESLREKSRAQALYRIHRALAAALFDDTAALCDHAAASLPLLPFIQGFYPSALAHLLHALALARRVAKADPEARGELVTQLDAETRWLSLRAADAPHNFLHLSHLVAAERAWALGELPDAALFFDKALLAVENLERPWHRAFITERAGLFHHQCGLAAVGRRLLREACTLYAAWGAAAKVRQLAESHPFLRPAQRGNGGDAGGAGVTVSSDSIELLAILRASQALSSETNLERLKAAVVQQLSSLAGASAVFLLVWSDEGARWLLLDTAEGTAPPVPVDEAGSERLLPLSALRYAERTQKPLLVADAPHDERFCCDPYLVGIEHCSLMLVPILSQGARRAMLILENRLSSGAFTYDRLDAVQLMAGQLAVSLENALLYEKLEERVAERTRELREAQSKLVATARQAGMAEIATNVLHNVGNVLNSVNVSAGLLEDALRDSRVDGLGKVVRLLEAHAADLGSFFTKDEKGRLLPRYLAKLSEALEAERRATFAELGRLTGSVDHIKQIVATQQSYAGARAVREEVRLADLIEDALRMDAESLTRHRVTVIRQNADDPVLALDRGRVLQILVNLIGNAKHAMAAVEEGARRLTLSVELVEDSRLRIRVRDEGEGISAENLSRIFNHGFTTRKGGHGFGLHSCALAAREMGGTLQAASDGVGSGATFTLELPLDKAIS